MYAKKNNNNGNNPSESHFQFGEVVPGSAIIF